MLREKIGKKKVQSTRQFSIFKRFTRREEGTAIKMNSEGCWYQFVDFGYPLDFEGVPKSIVFVQNQHRLGNNGDQEQCQKQK